MEAHTGGAGFDLVYDSVGGPNIAASIEAAALNGQIATTASMVEMDLTAAHLKGVPLHVVSMLIPMLHDHGRAAHGEILAKRAEIADTGALKPILCDETFGFDEVDAACAKLASGDVIGKVVVDVA